VAGYPGKFFNYKSQEYIKKLQAFTHTDRLNKQKEALLFYNVDTSAGQSGSPVYYKHNNIKYVVGIHIYGNDTN
jgi:V8-like Glu-specific endopeptidase